MATISINNLARAIYESSRDKEGRELDAVIKRIVDMLAKKHLLSKSKEIIDVLEKTIDKASGTVRATVSTKDKIDKKIINEIEDYVKKR